MNLDTEMVFVVYSPQLAAHNPWYRGGHVVLPAAFVLPCCSPPLSASL
jgi:hypothetical protein